MSVQRQRRSDPVHRCVVNGLKGLPVVHVVGNVGWMSMLNGSGLRDQGFGRIGKLSRENSCIADPSRTKRVYHSAMLSHVSPTKSRAYRSKTADAGGMGTRQPAHADRRRADACGLAAIDYHRH